VPVEVLPTPPVTVAIEQLPRAASLAAADFAEDTAPAASTAAIEEAHSAAASPVLQNSVLMPWVTVTVERTDGAQSDTHRVADDTGAGALTPPPPLAIPTRVPVIVYSEPQPRSPLPTQRAPSPVAPQQVLSPLPQQNVLQQRLSPQAPVLPLQPAKTGYTPESSARGGRRMGG
jgi:hypothetical protein